MLRRGKSLSSMLLNSAIQPRWWERTLMSRSRKATFASRSVMLAVISLSCMWSVHKTYTYCALFISQATSICSGYGGNGDECESHAIHGGGNGTQEHMLAYAMVIFMLLIIICTEWRAARRPYSMARGKYYLSICISSVSVIRFLCMHLLSKRKWRRRRRAKI